MFVVSAVMAEGNILRDGSLSPLAHPMNDRDTSMFFVSAVGHDGRENYKTLLSASVDV